VTAPAPLACPKCQAEILGLLAPPGSPRPCGACERPLEGWTFAAWQRPPATGKPAEALVAAEDAGCFYHPQSRAQVPCDFCGRFLCALCDVELLGEHFCPGCVDAGKKKKRIRSLDNDRILYGGIALMVAVLPVLLFWPMTLVTGPLAIFTAIYGWKKPRSLTGAGRASLLVAIFLGLVETAAWTLLFLGLFKAF
jgi:hypothetical protein